MTAPGGRDVVVLALALSTFGASFGIASGTFGVSLGMACVMSLVIYAGASQFAALGAVAAGASPVTAVATALLVNARFAPLGLATARRLSVGWGQRLVAAHLLSDPGGAMTLSADDPRSARRIYWMSGIALFAAWNVGALVGALAAGSIADPQTLGLDAAFPATLLGLLAPWLREARARGAALVGAALALVLLPVSPPGVPVLVAATGGLVGVLGRRRAGATPRGLQ